MGKRRRDRRSKSDLHNKFTSEGKSFAEVNKEEKEMEEQQKKILCEIRTIQGLYIPCELAVSEFTLLDGVKRLMHVLINPGDLPLGYKYESMTHSQETHKIPIPHKHQLEGAVEDYAQIFHRLYAFLQQGKSDSKIPPLYTIASQLEPCQSITTTLCDSVSADNVFRVYPAKELFFELQHMCVDVFKPTDVNIVKIPFTSLAERELEKDIFDYCADLCCNFHKGNDATAYCSLSYVQRQCYLILVYCHQVTKMPLIPGRHMPKPTNASEFSTLKTPVRQRKNGTQNLSTAMQKLHIAGNENMAQSAAQQPAMNIGRQDTEQAAGCTRTFCAPKKISKAVNLLLPGVYDDMFPPLGS